MASSLSYAADAPDENSIRRDKVLTLLGSIGVDSHEVVNLVDYVADNTKDGYLHLKEEHVAGGSLKLHYEFGGGVDTDNFELHYTPDDSHFLYRARKEAMMVNYSFNF